LSKYRVDSSELSSEQPESAERNLWLAVIERALKDYCFFFDRIQEKGTSYLTKGCKGKKSSRNKCLHEISRLRWFLYGIPAEPFNLEYLITELYDDSDNVLQSIRSHATSQFKRHILEQQDKGKFDALVSEMYGFVPECPIAPATTESTLRQRRNRVSGLHRKS
jgi:aminopeptidase C